MRRVICGAVCGALLSLGLGSSAHAADRVEPLNQYTVTNGDPPGYDAGEGGIVATPAQADALRENGFELKPLGKENTATAPAATIPLADPTWGYDVWRPWNLKPAPCPGTCSGAVDANGQPVSLKQWMDAQAAANPTLVKRVVYGTSVNGQELVAYKVTKGAQTSADGSKPGVMYHGAQHAREWISAEVVRREFKYVLDHQSDAASGVPAVLDADELWFIPVFNVDGYDYTFQSRATRLWRKNLRDNNNNGTIATGDGIDTNRNFAEKWRYDNEGASDSTTSDTYRGPSPESEPEVSSFHNLMRTIHPVFHIDYHSFAMLVLYPVGWQVETYGGDTPLMAALAGDDQHPAVAGYDPDVGGELYTTNGEITDTMYLEHGILAYTIELDGGSGSPVGGTTATGNTVGMNPGGFVFQDRESDIEAVFQKNLPFFMDLAQSAPHPDTPVSHLNNPIPEFVPVTFPTSYGNPQTVEVNPKRSLGRVVANSQAGLSPNTAPTAGPSYLSTYLDALADDGIPADVYDMDAQNREQADLLGVLSHYKAVIWYTGLDDYVRDPGQTVGVTKMFDDQMVSIRDYLNEGGKVLVTGQRALQGAWSQYAYKPLGRFPDKPQCRSNTSGTGPVGQLENCVNVSDDFLQYWMGAYARANQATTAAAVSAPAITGASPFSGSFGLTNQSFLARFTPTSTQLPVASFPQFASMPAFVPGTSAVGVATDDTLLWGFGLENLASRATRADVLKQGLNSLGVTAYTNTTGGVNATVPATLGLTLGTPAAFGTFLPATDRTYTATTTADVVSSAADAALTVSDPGHLTNGAFALPDALQVDIAPGTWSEPVSHAASTITFRQHIGST